MRNKLQRYAVVAPSFPARRRPVTEHVALMASATGAMILGSRENHLVVAFRFHVAFYRLSKAWPSGAAFIFVGAVEQR